MKKAILPILVIAIIGFFVYYASISDTLYSENQLNEAETLGYNTSFENNDIYKNQLDTLSNEYATLSSEYSQQQKLLQNLKDSNIEYNEQIASLNQQINSTAGLDTNEQYQNTLNSFNSYSDAVNSYDTYNNICVIHYTDYSDSSEYRTCKKGITISFADSNKTYQVESIHGDLFILPGSQSFTLTDYYYEISEVTNND